MSDKKNVENLEEGMYVTKHGSIVFITEVDEHGKAHLRPKGSNKIMVLGPEQVAALGLDRIQI